LAIKILGPTPFAATLFYGFSVWVYYFDRVIGIKVRGGSAWIATACDEEMLPNIWQAPNYR